MTALRPWWADVRGADALERALAAETRQRVEVEVDLSGPQAHGELARVLEIAAANPRHRWLVVSRSPGNALLRAWERLDPSLDDRVDRAGHVAVGLVCETELEARSAAPTLFIAAPRRVLVLEPRESMSLADVLPRWSIGWVLARGPESDETRAVRLSWIDRLERECRDAGVPFCFEQWGPWTPVPWDQALRFRPLAWGVDSHRGFVSHGRSMPRTPNPADAERFALMIGRRSLVRGRALRAEPRWWR